MIAGIGTDIVRIQRLTDPLIKKILSESEFKIYLSFSSEKRKKEFAAGRFAAKEALIKASGSFIPFDQIEVLTLPNGKPFFSKSTYDYLFSALGDIKLHISISHEEEYATAFVLIERSVPEENL
ncbi:MAG TPA: holo-ACP synthase [Petrotogaceae bacterium]|jgi:holo-[acyl-carrier protein] synthase|nr:holo-ACP synthase [Petrotogaceae bacterium]HQF32232.1 holo-ACP synthase [Petrotogaceae bacterium]HQH32314.1 holo-ACP synthase [Petrotogaceae bacterium]HQI77950.1 holo-ACP synthase [Petrotogaceae bacterium]